MNSVVNQTVAVVDYGMGNLRSVAQAVIHATTDTHVNAVITSSPQQVRDAHRVVLPGQGAMADCMRELRESGLLESVLEAAATKPLFGVCVGMQMLLDHSAEGHTAAGTSGLGLIGGEVIRFDLAGQTAPDGSRYKVPQMGWNRVHQARPLTATAAQLAQLRALWLERPLNPADTAIASAPLWLVGAWPAYASYLEQQKTLAAHAGRPLPRLCGM